MTLEEIKSSDKLFLTPADVAPVLGTEPQLIRWQAHNRPGLLGFNTCVVGNRTKIPRKAFLAWLEGNQIEGSV